MEALMVFWFAQYLRVESLTSRHQSTSFTDATSIPVNNFKAFLKEEDGVNRILCCQLVILLHVPFLFYDIRAKRMVVHLSHHHTNG